MSLPSDINPQLLALSSGYNFTRSLRFRSSASAYLNRTPSVAGNRQKFTISVWYKAGGISASEVNANILNAGGDGSSVLISGTGAFGPTYIDRLLFREAGTTLFYWPMVFRDPAAWYHIVFAMDTTQATASNRAKLYVNGVDQGAFLGTAITQNTSTSINNTSAHYINTYNGTFYPSGLYYTEYNFVDGQQLTPSSFGSTNATTGVWQPARYTGTYGTNGFYLPFTDNSALTTASNVGLGKDFSGNANYWVTNNISITAGVTYDSMTDVPTLTSATAANFAVLNPLDCDDLTTGSVYNSNLAWAGVYASKNGHPIRSTFRTPPTGKWYVEARNVTYSGSGNSLPIGFTYSTQAITSASVFASTIDSFIGVDASVFSNFVKFRTTGVSASLADNATLFASCASSDVINFAIDLNAGKFWIGKNGTWYNSGDPAAGTNATSTFTVGSGNWTFLAEYVSAGDNGNRSSAVLNFGQQPFTLTPPSGFLALNTYNLPTSTIVKGNTVMDATLYTGTGATQSITNASGFKPDFVWLKSRSATTNHQIFDSVRGTTKVLVTNSTEAETTSANTITSFNSGGFTVGTNTAINTSAATYVGWQWQAGQGSSSTNTDGSITSTVSVNASAGFSVVTYTGNGDNFNVGHGLGVTPRMIIVKGRSNTSDWYVYHADAGEQNYLLLNSTAAKTSNANYFRDISLSSTIFSGTNSASGLNTNGVTYVAYCWTPIAGFSAFGSYTGNGATDGPFIYTGFRPRWVMIKASSTTSQWVLWDAARNTYNVTNSILYPNLSAAEASFSIDILSNGFKFRESGGAGNDSGVTYIYAAFAENPFKNSLAR